MKTIKLTILLLFSPVTFFAQSLTGLWIGTLSNDSTTVRKDQSFEIVLTQYKEKVYGYSRSTFIVNDTLYYIVKRVKGTIENDVCEVKDDDIISHNFPRKPDKGVKLISTFRRNQQDSVWRLDGDWKTTESKKHRYYSISGKISLKTEPDLEKSKIFPHLEELNLANDIAFYKESKKAQQDLTAVTKQSTADNKKESSYKETKPPITSIKEPNQDDIARTTATTEPALLKQPKVNSKTSVVKEKDQVVTVNNTKAEDIVNVPIKKEPGMKTKQPTKDVKKDQTIKDEKPVVKQEPQKAEPVAFTKPVEQKKNISTEPAKKDIGKPQTTVAVINKEKQQPLPIIPDIKPAISNAAAAIAERKIAAPQTVFFKSDSLELSLYDNGEVDGDTVSVLLNGEIILAKQGLKTSAIKKTIYIPTDKEDSLTLVLYAENLGKYPPNTGLLVVHDGEDVYQIRFSADLQQNAAVIFKRKRN
jgi:hypothetical protein